jgi:mRNA-degrading endonuclease toxin of MazEF toxin-antitoxin module
VLPGEVRLVWFPFSHSEPQPYKQRPVLVIRAVGTAPDRAILVAMITANARRVKRPSPGDVVVGDWQNAGLKAPSVVRTRRLWTAEERDFTPGSPLGVVSATVLNDVRVKVRTLVQ